MHRSMLHALLMSLVYRLLWPPRRGGGVKVEQQPTFSNRANNPVPGRKKVAVDCSIAPGPGSHGTLDANQSFFSFQV